MRRASARISRTSCGSSRRAAYRSVLVLDDTEKFVAPGDDWRPGCGLGREPLSTTACVCSPTSRSIWSSPPIHASMPVAKVVEVCDRIGPDRIEVPRILPDKEAAPMTAILARRLERGGVGTPLEEVIDADAISALTTLYHDRKSDLTIGPADCSRCRRTSARARLLDDPGARRRRRDRRDPSLEG